MTAAPHHAARIAGLPRLPAVRSCFQLCVGINIVGHNFIMVSDIALAHQGFALGTGPDVTFQRRGAQPVPVFLS